MKESVIGFERKSRIGGEKKRKERKTHTNFYRDENDDNLLEAFGMSTGHGLLQELQHVLQHLDAGVEQVDALWDLEITSRRVVKRSQVGVRLEEGGDAKSSKLVCRCARRAKHPAYPEHIRRIQHGAYGRDVGS